MKGLLRRLLRRTLVRRMTLALLPSFVLVWVVLTAYSYTRATDDEKNEKDMRHLAAGLITELRDVDDPSRAAAITAATSNQINFSRRNIEVPGAVLMQLTDAQGHLVYRSPQADKPLPAVPKGHFTHATVQGLPSLLTADGSDRWSLVIVIPQPDDSWLLMFLGRDLVSYLLIALPVVLLPFWIAIVQGLRPLKRLSGHIAARQPNDLSPLGLTAGYAELDPLVGALDGLLLQLRGKIKREHAFVQDAAHELRTPLAVISAQAHVLAKSGTPGERIEAEQRLDVAIARASHLIEQLLALARVDQERPLEVESLDIAQALREELAQQAPAALARDIELSLEAPDTLWHLAEHHSLRSIAHNLLGNAIRYGRQGGQVRVGLEVSGGALVLTVADDGPGIAEAERQLVFERFYRAAGQDASGTGLGLAIVQQAVSRLGGDIRLDTGLQGRGCCFTVTLPTERPTG